jgi:hypothetical protein
MHSGAGRLPPSNQIMEFWRESSCIIGGFDMMTQRVCPLSEVVKSSSDRITKFWRESSCIIGGLGVMTQQSALLVRVAG